MTRFLLKLLLLLGCLQAIDGVAAPADGVEQPALVIAYDAPATEDDASCDGAQTGGEETPAAESGTNDGGE